GHLKWWGMGAQGENAPKLLPGFEASTGISVEVQSLPWTGVHEKLLSANVGGSLPDVMLLANGWVPELTMLGALARVPDRHRELLSGQFPTLAKAVKIRGTAMAAPWTADSWLQYYRTDLLAQIGYPSPPIRWDDWTRMATAYKRRNPDTFVTLHLLNWPEPLLNFGAQIGEPLLRDRAARGNFSSAGFKTALAFYKSIFDANFSPKVTGVEAGDTILDFTRGYYAILPASAEAMGQLRRPTYAFPAERWNTAATPSPTGEEGVWAAGNCLGVSRMSQMPDQAWALVDYLCRVPTQLQFQGLTGDLPSRPAAWGAPALARSRPEQGFVRAIASGVTGTSVPESARITTEIQLVAEHMVRGEYGVDVAAAEMDRRVDAILAKRRWLLDRGSIS
uniref:extracellular solute-binding protein n=1 Tax=Sphingomonas sp. TaxID=28214 RepID=UPI0025CD4CF6